MGEDGERPGRDCDGQVDVFVVVEVGGCEPRRAGADDDRRDRRRRELPGAVPEQDRDGVVELVRDREILLAVLVEVGDLHAVGHLPDGDRRAGSLREASLAVAEEDREVRRGHERHPGADVWDDEIEPVIADL